jgi:hypothetical protein
MSSKVDKLVGLLRFKFFPRSTLDTQRLATVGIIFADKKRNTQEVCQALESFLSLRCGKVQLPHYSCNQ